MLYLWVAGMKASLWHIKRITSGTHHTSEQVGLPLHTTKRCQYSVHDMAVEDTVELSCCPTCPWLCLFISFVRKSQLFLKILPNPLCQLCRQPEQRWVCSPVNILQPIWIVYLSFTEVKGGAGSCTNSILLGLRRLISRHSLTHKTCQVSVACLIIN